MTAPHPQRTVPVSAPIAFLMSHDFQVLTVEGGYRVDNVVLSPRQLVGKANTLAARLGKPKSWTLRDLTPSAYAGGASR